MTEPSKHPFPAPAPAKAPPAHFLPAQTRLRLDGWTPERQQRFVEVLADCGCVSIAARAVGMSRASAYALRRRAPNSMFAYAWDAAMKLAQAQLYDLAMERAIEGNVTTVYYRGEPVGERHTYDNRLLTFLLQNAHRFDTTGRSTDELVQLWPAMLESIDLVGPPPISREALGEMMAEGEKDMGVTAGASAPAPAAAPAPATTPTTVPAVPSPSPSAAPPPPPSTPPAAPCRPPAMQAENRAPPGFTAASTGRAERPPPRVSSPWDLSP